MNGQQEFYGMQKKTLTLADTTQNDYLQCLHKSASRLCWSGVIFCKDAYKPPEGQTKGQDCQLYRWAGFFGELLVCFAVKPSQISWSSDYSTLIDKSSGWIGMT